MFSNDVCVSLLGLLPKHIQRTWAYPSSSVLHKKYPLISFFFIFRYQQTRKEEHKVNLKSLSNNTVLLVAPRQSAQSLPNPLSGKSITMQTLRHTHRLDLRLVGVLGGGIAE